MGKNKSKNKGKQFEERVAKIFRECWHLSKHECHRALSSGTYQVDYSDIVFSPETIERPHLIVECKKRKSVPANQLLTFTSEFNNWLEQVEEASEKYFQHFQVYPVSLIVFAVNNMRPIVIVDQELLSLIPSKPEFNLYLIKHPTSLNFYIVNNNYIGTWLDLFLNECLQPKYRY